MQPMRQGDVLLIPTDEQPREDARKMPHLVLAEGEITGHCHQIRNALLTGHASMYPHGEDKLLVVDAEHVPLTHEEHKQIDVPKGNWIVRIQREYQPEGWRRVMD